MNNILEQIIASKKQEVATRKSLYPVKLLEQSVHFEAPVVSLRKYLARADKAGIIAEIKRKSPSAGMINRYASAEQVSIAYMQAGASALSVLTDEVFFGGSNEDLLTARRFNYCPILRKDFIVDEYQLTEARAIGADVILLIATVHTPARICELARFAKSLHLEVLLEVHDREELGHVNEHTDVIGVNNRNLGDFTVNIERSCDLLQYIPQGFMKIAESGIDRPEQAVMLKKAGYDGFLAGSVFMKESDPGAACASFIRTYKHLMYGD